MSKRRVSFSVIEPPEKARKISESKEEDMSRPSESSTATKAAKEPELKVAEEKKKKGTGSALKKAPEGKSIIKYKPFKLKDCEGWMVDDRYSKGTYLTAGAYGEICKAHDKRTKDYVVIKRVQILDKNLDNDWDNAIRILREVYFLRRFGPHPFICPLLDLFPNPPPPLSSPADFTHVYIVCKLFRDGSLDDLNLKSLTEIAGILFRILLAVRFLHRHNVLHRDLKRANIFLDRKRDEVVIGDFGLSREKKNDMTFDVLTKPYRPPCLILESNIYSTEIDVFAIGCILFELCGLDKTEYLFPDRCKMDLHLKRQMAISPPSDLPGHKGSKFVGLRTYARQKEVDLDSMLEEVEGGGGGGQRVGAGQRRRKTKKGQKIREEKKDGPTRWSRLKDRLRILEKSDKRYPEYSKFSKSDDNTDKIFSTHPCVDLCKKLLNFNPRYRITVEEALKHPFFERLPLSSRQRWEGLDQQAEEFVPPGDGREEEDAPLTPEPTPEAEGAKKKTKGKAREMFQENVEHAGRSNAQRARCVKLGLWRMLRQASKEREDQLDEFWEHFYEEHRVGTLTGGFMMGFCAVPILSIDKKDGMTGFVHGISESILIFVLGVAVSYCEHKDGFIDFGESTFKLAVGRFSRILLYAWLGCFMVGSVYRFKGVWKLLGFIAGLVIWMLALCHLILICMPKEAGKTDPVGPTYGATEGAEDEKEEP